jgi:prepilin-type processing-associated H-X9-DG protein
MLLMGCSVRPKEVNDDFSNPFAIGERGSFAAQNAWAGTLGDGRRGGEVLAMVATSGPDPTNPSLTSLSGPHTGMTQFLMADGSVHPLWPTIHTTVYRALASRNGREVIDRGAY